MNRMSNIPAWRWAVLVAAVCVLGTVTYAAEPTTLTNGVAATGIAGAAASEKFYKIDVPAGQDSLEIKTSGGTGDVDLYVRRGTQPTTTSYDYRPYKVGNEETVDVNNPAAGTWYIMLRGYASYSNVTLKATYSATVSVKALTNGVAATAIGAAANTELYYSIEVPAGRTKLEIIMSGGTGDADLYVKRDSLPTTSNYDYRPYLVGNEEAVAVDNPTAGTWYIMIRGYSAFSGITLLASHAGSGGGGGTGKPLEDNVAVTGLSGAAGAELLYRIDLPAGHPSLKIEMSGGTGDADLYVRLRTPPTQTEYDYRPYQQGNNETVTIPQPAAGTWFVLIRGYSSFSGVTLLASWGKESVVILQDNVPVHNLAGEVGNEKFYRIDVPGGQTNLTFETSGGTGNVDMYIKKGARPTTTSFDYRPADGGNNESINISSSELEGAWYVLLKGVKAYSGVTLVGNYYASESVTTLQNGVPLSGIAGGANTEKFYKIDVPANQQKLEIRMSGGTGDADMYVRRGAKPSTSDYDYRPYQTGNEESVAVDKPAAGTWYIMIRGYSAFSGITLMATYGGGTPPEDVITLQNGVAVTGIKGDADGERFYKITVPSGQAKLEVVTSGGTGDVDLYVKQGAKPSTSSYDYRPYLLGNDESVTIENPPAATYYILLRGYSAYDGVTLKATYTPLAEQVTALTNGVAVTGISGSASSEKFYKIDVPSSQEFLSVEISGGTGDADLYVKRGAKPTFTSWDYRPYLIGNNERVDVSHPAAATWYIMLKGYHPYSGVTLKATYGTTTPPPPAGNNFASDPNCVALWRFESSALTADSVGANTLQNHGVTASTAQKKEGASSAALSARDLDYFSITDASLSAKFPLKTGDPDKNISVCTWFRMDSLPVFYQ
ncbi:MAG: PPC domain-containing protein, partial [Planctomycetes bacterium]|nr:PPC domain-containing protein [Planctomycetota bacterium]